MSDVVLLGELSEKINRAFVGVIFEDFPRGIFEVETIALISVNLFLKKFRAQSEVFLGARYFLELDIDGFFDFRA